MSGLSDAELRRWLQAPGSLTAHLRRFGVVEVRVQRQGRMALWGAEQADLRQRSGYVREVVLMLNGRAAVWARSCTSQACSKGPWRALRGLGTRPLAELLFAQRALRRLPLRTEQLHQGGPVQRHIRRQWQQLAPNALPAALPRFARSSVFWHKDHALRVMEAFSPWVCTLM